MKKEDFYFLQETHSKLKLDVESYGIQLDNFDYEDFIQKIENNELQPSVTFSCKYEKEEVFYKIVILNYLSSYTLFSEVKNLIIGYSNNMIDLIGEIVKNGKFGCINSIGINMALIYFKTKNDNDYIIANEDNIKDNSIAKCIANEISQVSLYLAFQLKSLYLKKKMPFQKQ